MVFDTPGVFSPLLTAFDPELAAQLSAEIVARSVGVADAGSVGLHLLYRGSEHGMTPGAFHTLCDESGPTLTIAVGTTAGGPHPWADAPGTARLFGGYSDTPWGSPSAPGRVFNVDGHAVTVIPATRVVSGPTSGPSFAATGPGSAMTLAAFSMGSEGPDVPYTRGYMFSIEGPGDCFFQNVVIADVEVYAVTIE